MCENQEKPVDIKKLSPESQEVAECMRQQIAMGAYPGDEVIDETVEILLPILKKS